MGGAELQEDEEVERTATLLAPSAARAKPFVSGPRLRDWLVLALKQSVSFATAGCRAKGSRVF